jgi:prepilin-type N-terminal cleavage/methylation domain-containing protein
MTISPTPRRRRASRSDGFTLVEILMATALAAFLLAAVLSANLHIARSGLRAARYAQLEPEVRRGLTALGVDLRGASGFTRNGPADITLTIPNPTGATTQITYAWASDTTSLFRVAGANSTQTTGRIYLIPNLPAAADGTPGIVFDRLDSAGAAAATDAATKQIRVRLTAALGTGTGAAVTRTTSAVFLLRNKSAP